MLRLTSFIYLFPVLVLIPFIIICGMRAPHWDEWEIAVIFENIATGTVGFKDFTEIHNDHSYFFLRLIIVPLAFLSGWNKIYEMFLSLGLVVINAALIVNLSKRQNPQLAHSKKFHLVNGISCLILFSLVQYQNWLWGLQLGVFLVNLCLTTAIFILSLNKKINSLKSLMLAALPMAIASFTLAQGLIGWLALLPSVFLAEKSIKKSLRNCLFWLGLFGITLAIYFGGYTSDNPSQFQPSYLWEYPLFWFKFLFILLGAPLSPYSTNLAGILGMIISGGFLGAIAWGYKYKGRQFLSNIAPWISLGLFSLLFASITTFGRVGSALMTDLDFDFALGSRYTSNSLFLWIAVLQIFLYFATVDNLIKQWKRGLTILAMVIIFLTGINSVHGWEGGKESYHISRSITSCLKVLQVLDNHSRQCWNWFEIMPSRDIVKHRTKTLNDLGLIDSPSLQFINSPGNNGSMVWDNPQSVFSMSHQDGWISVKGYVEKNQDNVKPPDLVAIYNLEKKSVIGFYEIDPRLWNWVDTTDWMTGVPTSAFNLYQNTEIQAGIVNLDTQEWLPLQGKKVIKIILDQVPNPQFNRQPEQVYGYINSELNSITVNPNQAFMVNGWAAFGDRHQQPDRVFLSYGDKDFFFTNTEVNLETPLVAEHFNSDRYNQAGWMTEVYAQDLPLGETKIYGWVYDPKAQEFVTLNDEITVNVQVEDEVKYE